MFPPFLFALPRECFYSDPKYPKYPNGPGSYIADAAPVPAPGCGRNDCRLAARFQQLEPVRGLIGNRRSILFSASQWGQTRLVYQIWQPIESDPSDHPSMASDHAPYSMPA